MQLKTFYIYTALQNITKLNGLITLIIRNYYNKNNVQQQRKEKKYKERNLKVIIY